MPVPDEGHQRVDVAVRLGLVVPVGMNVLVEGSIFADDVLQMALPAVAPFVGGQAIEHGLIRSPLQIHVERGINLQAAFVDLVGSVFAFQVAADLFDKIRSQRIRIVRQMQDYRCGARVRGLRGGDLAIFEHGVDHQIAPLLGAVGMIDGRIDGRTLGQTGQQRGFFQRQFLCRLAEVELRGGFESVDAVAEKNLVGIQGKDLRLGETALDLDREHRFLHLALPTAVGRKEKIARQLHGQRRCALHLAAGVDVAIGGAHDAPEIDSGVAIEIFVFDRDQRVAQDRREIVVARDHAALQRERADDAAVIVVEFGDRAGTVGFQSVDLRQVGRVDEQEAGSRAHQDGDQHEQTEQNAANQLAPTDFDRRESVVERLHQETKSG